MPTQLAAIVTRPLSSVLHRDLEALAHLAEQRVGGQADAVERQRRGGLAAQAELAP
ncbi:MAG: hypothetical protein PGN15_06720 [Aeromicrobium erythreum]